MARMLYDPSKTANAFKCMCGKAFGYRAELARHILDMGIWRDERGKHGRMPRRLLCGCMSDATFICEEHSHGKQAIAAK